MIKDSSGKLYDGYISSISAGDKVYAIKAVVFESHPMICERCGASFDIDSYGRGVCPACGTKYSSQVVLVEE